MNKRLTRNDIAQQLGISPSTVSRALSGSPLISAATIALVCETAERLGYRPNVLGRRLAANRSFQIGMAAPLGMARRGTFQVSYFSAILDGLVATGYEYGYSICINPFEDGSPCMVQRLTALVASHQVDGLVLIGLKRHSRIPANLARQGIPVVLVGARSSMAEVAAVNCDPLPGLHELVADVWARGYRGLVYVGGQEEYHDAVAQHKGLIKVLKKSPLKLIDNLKGDYSRRSGYAAAARIMEIVKADSRRICVFMANDRMAAGFYRYCQERGIRIPEDVGVVGSDNDESGATLYPDLSTIHQPRREMGGAAVQLIDDIIKGKKPRKIEIDKHYISKASL